MKKIQTIANVIGKAGLRMADADWFDRQYDLMEFHPEDEPKDDPRVAFEIVKYAIHRRLGMYVKTAGVYHRYNNDVWMSIYSFYLGEQPMGEDFMNHFYDNAVMKWGRENWSKFLTECATFYCGDDRWMEWR